MIVINEKKDCCGCTACYNICPKNAITMVIDQEGFKYPEVNESLCVNCQLCVKVCPVKKNNLYDYPIEGFVVQNKSDSVRYNSTSGASINPIAEWIIEQNGSVVGAALVNNECRHIIVENKEDLVLLQGSKYVQSDLQSVFIEIREKINAGKKVLFIGMPCQVEGLKSYIGKHNDLLYTIDLACHGVPSPELFKKYVSYIERRHNKKVKNVIFRDKTYGYAAMNQKIIFEDGSSRDCAYDVKTFSRMMFSGLSLRPSCYQCHFKSEGRCSDMTVFDCGMIGVHYPEMDDDKGTTSILIHSGKGKMLISNPNIQEKYNIMQCDPQTLIDTEGTMLVSSAKLNSRRTEFFQDYINMSYEELCKKYVGKSLKMLAGNLVKKSLFVTGPFGKAVLKAYKKKTIKDYLKKYST